MTCTLCGLASGEAAFCCAGCENVYAILVESGVVGSGQNFRDTDLFRQSLRLGLISNGSKGTGQRPVPASTQECVLCRDSSRHLFAGLTQFRGQASARVPTRQA